MTTSRSSRETREALAALRQAIEDADGVTTDMLAAPRRRELGPALHRKKYHDARLSILAGLDYLDELAAKAAGSESG